VNWRPAVPELIISAVAVAAAALAAAAVAGWPGVVAVAVAVAVIAQILQRAVLPRSAIQAQRKVPGKQRARAISGYGQRRFVVISSLASRASYESDLRPALEHVLAARLADNHGVNLYTDPGRARRVFCRTTADARLWPWIDPGQVLDAQVRAEPGHAIPSRTLARLITRLEQL
jgi:hypothetical protein